MEEGDKPVNVTVDVCIAGLIKKNKIRVTNGNSKTRRSI